MENAYLHVDQFRGFEKFCEGRMFFEMPTITPRICGICPVSHHLASVKAADAIAGVCPPRPAALLRSLMHKGQFIQSHSMHFFHLAGPDLIFGFDADPAIRNVVGIIEANPTLADQGRQAAQVGPGHHPHAGGPQHPRHVRRPGRREQGADRGRARRVARAGGRDDRLHAGRHGARQGLDRDQHGSGAALRQFPHRLHGHGRPRGRRLRLYDGDLRLVDKNGRLLEQFHPSKYLNYIAEHTEDWSYLKFPYYKKMGWPDGVYRVAPLGRLNVAEQHQHAARERGVQEVQGAGGKAPWSRRCSCTTPA